MALYFACSENLDEPANVWGIARIPEEKYDLDMLRLATSKHRRDSPFTLYGEPEQARYLIYQAGHNVRVQVVGAAGEQAGAEFNHDAVIR